MRRTITGLFKSLEQCEQAILKIDNNGLANNQISVVVKLAPQNDLNYEYAAEITGENAVEMLHDLDSLLVQVHDMQLEEVGPAAAGGPLAGALKQGDKSLATCLTYYGVNRDRARYLQKCVADGYVLTLIETDNSKANETANTLNHYGAQRVEKWSKSIEGPLLPHN